MTASKRGASGPRNPFPLTDRAPTLADVLHYAASIARIRRGDFVSGEAYHAMHDAVAMQKRAAMAAVDRVLWTRLVKSASTDAHRYQWASHVLAPYETHAPAVSAGGLRIVHRPAGSFDILFGSGEAPPLVVWAAVGAWMRRAFPDAFR